MSLLYNLARMTSSTTGTGAAIALVAAVAPCLTFAQAGVANGDVIDYAIADGTNSEIGTATYSSTGPQLTGRTPTKSTNSNAAINLSGSAQVFISPRAETLQDASLFTTGALGVARGGTGAGAFTAGSVVFAGTSGVYTQDNTNFFWDDTTNLLKLAGSTLVLGPAPSALFAGSTGILIGDGTSASGGTPGFAVNAPGSTNQGAFCGFQIAGNDAAYFGTKGGVIGGALAQGAYDLMFAATNITNGGGIQFRAQGITSAKGIFNFTSGSTGSNATVLDYSQVTAHEWSSGVNFNVNSGTTTPLALRVYNTYTSAGANYERGVFDWTTTANTLTIGTQAGGTGSSRSVDMVVGGTRVLRLPPNAGTSGYVLRTDGTGVTSWVTPGAATMAIGSAITSATVGSVLFAGTGPALAQDNTNFFWDDPNNILKLQVGKVTAWGSANFIYMDDPAVSFNFFAGGAGNATATAGGAIKNTIIGSLAGANLTNGSYNVALGYAALQLATTAQSNFALGTQALAAIVSGQNNVAIGTTSLNVFTGTGSNGNAAVGLNTLLALISGNDNVAIGNSTGRAFTSGGANTLVGGWAGYQITSGSNNTLIGAWGGPASALSSVIAFSDGSGSAPKLDYNYTNSAAWTFASNYVWIISADTTTTAFVLKNTSAGGKHWEFFSTGSANSPGQFGVYNQTDSRSGITISGTDSALKLISGAPLTWVASTTSSLGTPDTWIYKEAAGHLGFYGGTSLVSPTGLWLHNIYTTFTNKEFARFDWLLTANVLSIGTDKGSGGGSIRGMQFVVGGANALDYGVTSGSRWTFQAGATLVTSTATVPPLVIPAGTVLTSPATGVIEHDGKAFYATSVASARQVVDAEQVLIQNATRTFTNNTSAQAIFNASTNGAVTLAASTTYEFEMLVAATGFNAASHTINFGFGGTATYTSIAYYFDAQTGTTQATPAASATGYIAVATASAICAATTTTGLLLYVRGTMRINAGGTVIPQLTQVTASAAAVVQINSFFRCWPVGSNTVTNVGNWS